MVAQSRSLVHECDIQRLPELPLSTICFRRTARDEPGRGGWESVGCQPQHHVPHHAALGLLADYGCSGTAVSTYIFCLLSAYRYRMSMSCRAVNRFLLGCVGVASWVGSTTVHLLWTGALRCRVLSSVPRTHACTTERAWTPTSISGCAAGLATSVAI